jgi:hypothetical protein
MSATATVAVIGAIATPLVAIAGYVFNERRARADREATRALAEDAHIHERRLAEGAREHEERLRRNERLYEARREIYLDLLRQFRVEVQIVQRTANPESSREPPEMPPESEWGELRARIDAYSSDDVGKAVATFDSCVRDFHAEADALRKLLRGSRLIAGEETKKQEVSDARGSVMSAYETVQAPVREELANL